MRDENKGKLIRGKLISGRGRVGGFEEPVFFYFKEFISLFLKPSKQSSHRALKLICPLLICLYQVR